MIMNLSSFGIDDLSEYGIRAVTPTTWPPIAPGRWSIYAPLSLPANPTSHSVFLSIRFDENKFLK